MKNERVYKNAAGKWMVKIDGGAEVGPYDTRDEARAFGRVYFGVRTPPKKKAAPVVPPAPPITAAPVEKIVTFGSLTNPTQLLPKPKLKNKVLFLLDSSGSMGSIRKAAVDAFNNVLEAIRKGSAATDQETTVSLYTFGESGWHPVTVKYFDVDIRNVKPLTQAEYRPHDMTPLFDAVGMSINDALALKVDEHTSFIVNVITDGNENSSSRFTRTSIQTLLSQVQATDKWTVTFLVPAGHKQSTAAHLSVPMGNIQEWEASEAGAATASQQISTGYNNYFTSRSIGETFTKGFFTPDLSKVDANQVAKKLTDIAAKVDVLKVQKEMDIQAFVESTGHQYARGKGYYQLTKDEKVQSYKEILLKEKNKSTIYGGKEARDLLGLPATENVKVRPGNHGNWDIFIQSTSNNRILVRGTTFLYAK